MSTIRDIEVPDIGDFKDVAVIEVLVKAGDVLAREDTIIVLESDKAALDVPAPAAGRVKAVKVAVGDRVSQGSVILSLEASDAPAQATTPRSESSEAAPAPKPAASAQSLPAAETSAPAVRTEAIVHASPSVRKFARELGVDLTAVTARGPKGRVLQEDVQRFIKERMGSPPIAHQGGLDLLPWPKIDFEKFGPVERAPLSRIRRISGASLQRNAILIPHVTNFDEADVTELEAFRVALNKEPAEPGAKITMLAFVIKATVAALKEFPAFNASLDGEDVVLKRYYNIGFAADTPDGLVVPVIKDADRKGVVEIAAEMARLASEAREGRPKAGDMQGASFTISSLGGVGGTGFTPIINAPEVAILGLVRAQMKPVWNGSAFQPRLMQPLSVSWDHRVVDGVAAARFLGFLSRVLTEFRRVAL